jgi:hypothetical protein
MYPDTQVDARVFARLTAAPSTKSKDEREYKAEGTKTFLSAACPSTNLVVFIRWNLEPFY